eukprot:1216196-Pyramimonas_sp.AAC.2
MPLVFFTFSRGGAAGHQPAGFAEAGGGGNVAGGSGHCRAAPIRGAPALRGPAPVRNIPGIYQKYTTPDQWAASILGIY